MTFLPSLRGSRAQARETKSLDIVEPASWSGMIARLRDPRRSWPIERAVVEGLERVVWVFKSVNAIAGHASRLPIERIITKPDGEREVVADDPLARLLNKGRVNRLEKGPQLRKRLSGQVLLSPNGAFVEVTTNRRGQPIGLDLLPPGRTRPVPGRGGDLLSHFETIGPDGQRHAIDPERVLWFRDPHVTDPYRAITPMEAAGLSVDLDFLARLYNATFLRNDGRPGGVIGIDGEVDEDEMARIQASFGRGAHEAGKLTVLQGDLSFIDLAARPRDMAYADLARISKEEILAAFGVPESVIGNASGRTFDNAAQEELNFWQHTMLPHLSLLVTGWDADHDDASTYEYNTDSVEVLQRAKAARREEARKEFEAGLISPDEYRAIAGYDPVDLPHSRALYIAQGKTPIPTREEDAVALGIAPPEDAAAPLVQGEPASGGEQAEAAPPPTGPPQPEEGAALARLHALFAEEDPPAGDQGRTSSGRGEGQPAVRQTKALDGSDGASPRVDGLAAALDQLGVRLVERTVARLESPKQRKGTRHFVAEYEVDTRVGDAPLDTGRIVPEVAWQEEAAQAVLGALAAGGDGTVDEHLRAAEVAAVAGEEFSGVVSQIRDTIADLDRRGAPMDVIVAAVRSVDTKTWARTVLEQHTTPIDAVKE